MWEEILKAVPVFLFSALKFILGPTIGYGAKLHIVTTMVATIAGMMTVVVVITFGGEWFMKHVVERFRKHKKPGKKGKIGTFVMKLLAKYGLSGVAFFTPLFLTPIGGTIIAVSLGKPRKQIIIYMLISAVGWAAVFSFGIYFFLDQVKDWINLIR